MKLYSIQNLEKYACIYFMYVYGHYTWNIVSSFMLLQETQKQYNIKWGREGKKADDGRRVRSDVVYKFINQAFKSYFKTR